MKEKIEIKILKVISRAIMTTAIREANAACFLFSYQPKIPNGLKKISDDTK